MLVTSLPLFDRGGAGVQIAGEHRLTDIAALTQLLDVLGWNSRGYLRQARLIKLAHGGLADGTDRQQRGRRLVNRLKGFTLEFLAHDVSPQMPSSPAIAGPVCH
ncbi:hypothetical protein D3C80_1547680 [compost metagenome]